MTNQHKKELTNEKKQKQLEELRKPRYFPHPLHSRKHIEHMIRKWHEYAPEIKSRFENYMKHDFKSDDFIFTKKKVIQKMRTLEQTKETLLHLTKKYNEEHLNEQPIIFTGETVRDKEASVPSDNSSGSKSD